MDHGDALFAHAAGGGFQIQLGRHRDDKHKVVFAAALGHQRLIYAGRILPHAGGHGHAVHPLLVGVLVGRVGHLCPLQDPHCVRFCFFAHGMIPL